MDTRLSLQLRTRPCLKTWLLSFSKEVFGVTSSKLAALIGASTLLKMEANLNIGKMNFEVMIAQSKNDSGYICVAHPWLCHSSYRSHNSRHLQTERQCAKFYLFNHCSSRRPVRCAKPVSPLRCKLIATVYHNNNQTPSTDLKIDTSRSMSLIFEDSRKIHVHLRQVWNQQ